MNWSLSRLRASSFFQSTNWLRLKPRTLSTQSTGTSVDDEHRVKLESVDGGFIVDGEIFVKGPVLAHGSFWTMWKPHSVQNLQQEHLAILELIRPAPELLILGSGDKQAQLPSYLHSWFRRIGEQAIQYFNLLNQERRSVIAALFHEEIQEDAETHSSGPTR